MHEYHKINAPFKRNNNGDKKLRYGDWALPEFDYLSDTPWLWTEKVDGTNIRVEVEYDFARDEYEIHFAGRTNNAEIPPHLRLALTEQFDTVGFRSKIKELMQDYNISEIVLHGEGYGPKIQGGGKYRDTAGFVMFDVRVGEWWLQRDAVEEIGGRLGVDVVPIVMTGTIYKAIQVVRSGELRDWFGVEKTFGPGYLKSAWGEFEAEGLVGTPTVPLFNRKGERIVTKVKARDFR